MPKNVTISVPDDLAEKMEKMQDVNWSGVCREAIANYIMVRAPAEKSEMIERLEEYLKSKRKSEEDRREPIRSMEISRFTRKWGKPDFVQPDVSPGAWHPYVFLEKTIRVKHDGTESILKIANGLTSIMTDEKGERRKTDQAVIKGKEGWRDRTDILDIAEYFNSIGFNLQLGEYIMPITERWTGLSKHELREVLTYSSFELLFAFDNEDTVFLGYVQRSRPR